MEKKESKDQLRYERAKILAEIIEAAKYQQTTYVTHSEVTKVPTAQHLYTRACIKTNGLVKRLKEFDKEHGL